MFLGLTVFIILAIVALIVAIRTVKALFRLLTSHKEKGKEQEVAPKNGKKEKKGKEEEKANAESEKLSQQEDAGEDVVESPEDGLIRQRHEWAIADGITETFSSTDTSLELDPKAFADRCTGESGLTYLEYNNRELAGDDFYGFNLIIEKDSRMVLTYNGQAVASITKVEVKSTAIINGQVVEGTAPAWRINTFPPSLRPGMVPSDLEKMLTAADRIKACGQDPSRVVDTMTAVFSHPDNVNRLKNAVDRKIQEKESGRKADVRQKRTKSPVNLQSIKR